MSANKIVVGVFHFVDDTVKAIRAAKQNGHACRVYSPVPVPELMDEVAHERSPITYFSGVGALTGITAGFSLAILCSLDWPLRVSAKNVVAPPSFVPVGYEWTILFGSLATLLGLLIFCKLPNLRRVPGYDPRFSQNKFGVIVGCTAEQTDGMRSTLLESGAEEVSIQDAL